MKKYFAYIKREVAVVVSEVVAAGGNVARLYSRSVAFKLSFSCRRSHQGAASDSLTPLERCAKKSPLSPP